MSAFIRFKCAACAKALKAKPQLAGKTITCSSGQRMRVPGEEEEDDGEDPGTNWPPSKKAGGIPARTVGLALALIFFVGIVVSPGGLYSVMFGGLLGFVGLVISIIGIAMRSGRIASLFGIVFFILGWAVNTLAIGHL